MSERELTVAFEPTAEGLLITRKIFFSPSLSGWARWLEFVHNPTENDIPVNLGTLIFDYWSYFLYRVIDF